MRRRSGLSRIVLSAIAVLQIATPALAVVADARLLADGGAPQVHVEDHTQTSCRPVHPDDCALCRFLTHSSAPRGQAATVPALESRLASCSSLESLRPASASRAQARTRAPPVSLS